MRPTTLAALLAVAAAAGAVTVVSVVAANKKKAEEEAAAKKKQEEEEARKKEQVAAGAANGKLPWVIGDVNLWDGDKVDTAYRSFCEQCKIDSQPLSPATPPQNADCVKRCPLLQ